MRHLALAGCLLLAAWSNAATEDLYVSAGGDDAWSGRHPAANAVGSDGPFATLQRARDEVRALKQAGEPGPLTVHIRGGLYERTEPLRLSAEDGGTLDSPVTWRAYRDEEVRISGGAAVAGWRPLTDEAVLGRLDPAARAHILSADLPALGVEDFGELLPRGFGRGPKPAGLELTFRGAPMTPARWPNEGYVAIASVPEGRTGAFTYGGGRPKRWADHSCVWVHGFWTHNWADSYEAVAAIDVEERLIETLPPHGVYGYKAGGRYYFLNVLEELDTPGEWYLDRTSGRLYFWPPEPPREGDARVSIAESLIVMQDVSHVTIRGLTLEDARGTAVTIDGGSCVTLAGCTIRNIGCRALAINGGDHHSAVSCDIYNLGDGGIALTGGNRPTLSPGGHVLENCDIHDFSRTVRTYTPGVVVSGVGHAIRHNRIHDAPHMGIGLHGNEHVIEYNELSNLCTDTDDAGAFYMGRDWTERGNVLRYNYFHDIGGFTGRFGVRSIYIDDFASGCTIYGNLFVRGAMGVFLGGGRDNLVENNVFVDCRPAVWVDSRGVGWAHKYFDGTVTTLFDRLDAMNYRNPPYSEHYPELLTLLDDEPAVAKYNVIARNICVGGQWTQFHDPPTAGVVELSDNLVDIDPLFVDPDAGDYRLRADSPATALGFEPLPIHKMGLQGDEHRKIVE